MKQRINLTDKQLYGKINKIVTECLDKMVNEGFASRQMDELWIEAERQLGSENMLQEVYNYFNADQLTDFLKSINDEYDLCLFEDEEEYEEEEDDFDESSLPYQDDYKRWKQENGF